MIGIVNYGAGNIFSLTAALQRIGVEYGMINQVTDFDQYDRIIIPGVGHAGAAMKKLRETGLVEDILKLEKPVLGICVGMQLLTACSEEGNVELLDIFPLKTLHFDERIQLKVPHMGWNSVRAENDCPLFQDVPDNTYFYFVHSYFIEYSKQYTGAVCEYGLRYSAAIQKNNFYGVQFHPEKSGKCGETLLLNFSKI
ncbi:imidazole glycerol phosphate synthase subunit HisH [Sphingobacterium alkalisoli]|uniref:Imidazole glycerol phosphate synthase subunit HisH n=1 Tax=Sphingobacterium alkalisoli TaxID=1874115 RepID=A0A4U0GYS6_9SPHI|nr:imidazole glycerol phosphate synthase subunit HisH [Sphingobacterium alkalisoli]TJY64381.1 imidazole glycerol phosphate synthase subunit HisH [Sphingobacterium alkalisoli]GGH22086.1 imidazole glycerol phosphate synthase subunit HisH [Sphingobacterium alkalisoli]